MAIHLFVAEDLLKDRLIRDGRVIGNVTKFEARCSPDTPLLASYDLAGADFVFKKYSVENSPPSDITHPLEIRFGFDANEVKVLYKLEEIPLITELYVVQNAAPRSRLIRLVVLSINDELQEKLVAFKGVEVVIDHAAREAATGIEEDTFE